MISSPWIWKGVSATFKDTPSHIQGDDLCLFLFRVLITIVKRWIGLKLIPVKINDFKTKNYGQTEFDILPKLVRNEYKKPIGSIYVDQVNVTSTNIIISIDQFHSPVFKRVRSYINMINGAQT